MTCANIFFWFWLAWTLWYSLRNTIHYTESSRQRTAKKATATTNVLQHFRKKLKYHTITQQMSKFIFVLNEKVNQYFVCRIFFVVFFSWELHILNWIQCRRKFIKGHPFHIDLLKCEYNAKAFKMKINGHLKMQRLKLIAAEAAATSISTNQFDGVHWIFALWIHCCTLFHTKKTVHAVS